MAERADYARAMHPASEGVTMRIICVAVVAALLANSAARPDDAKPADRAGPILSRLAKMNRAEQQAWLQRLEEREKRAAAISLGAEDAKKETSKVHELLHRKMVTWAALREAIETTDSREREAIEKLARRYREQVFEAFYTQIDEYGRRQEAWNSVVRSWQAAGSPFDQQDRMIDWLEAAIRSVDPKAIGPVPGIPDFEAGIRE